MFRDLLTYYSLPSCIPLTILLIFSESTWRKSGEAVDSINLFIKLLLCKVDFPRKNEMRRCEYNSHAIFIVREPWLSLS